MSATITRGAATITPTAVTQYASDREAQNRVHVILGRPDPDVTLRPAQSRTGTLMLTFASVTAAADSKTAEDLHAASEGVFVLVSADVPTINMSYVPTGRVSRALDPTLKAWTLSIPFQEVIS